MGSTSAVTLLLIAALAIACDQPGTEIVITAAGRCHYARPSEIAAGEREVVVFGEAQADFYLIDDSASYQSIVDHYDSEGASHHPPGATRVFDVANHPGLHNDRSAQDGTSKTFAFAPGTYAVVCEWSSGDQGGRLVVSRLDVTS